MDFWGQQLVAVSGKLRKGYQLQESEFGTRTARG